MIGWVIRGLLLGLITTIAVIVVGKVTLLRWSCSGMPPEIMGESTESLMMSTENSEKM